MKLSSRYVLGIIMLCPLLILLFAAILGGIDVSELMEQQKNNNLVHIVVIGHPVEKGPEIWVDDFMSKKACSTMLMFEGYAQNGNYIEVGCFDFETNEPIPGLTKPELWPEYVSEYEAEHIYGKNF